MLAYSRCEEVDLVFVPQAWDEMGGGYDQNADWSGHLGPGNEFNVSLSNRQVGVFESGEMTNSYFCEFGKGRSLISSLSMALDMIEKLGLALGFLFG